MTEATEQAEDTTVEQPQTTTPAEQLALVERQMQERLNALATNDPIYQRYVGQRDILVALTSSSNGKVPYDDSTQTQEDLTDAHRQQKAL